MPDSSEFDAAFKSGLAVECRFDEQTGILHLIVNGQLSEDNPSAADLLELIAHHRAGRQINGIVIFPKDRAPQYAPMAPLPLE